MDDITSKTIPADDAVEESASRRNLLRLAGAAVAGGAAAAIVGSQEAAAATGDLIYGADNDAVDAATRLHSTFNGPVFHATNSATADETAGLVGESAVVGTSGVSVVHGTGVFGVIDLPGFFGWGVLGLATDDEGIAIVAIGGRTQLALAPHDAEGLPTGPHLIGEMLSNNDGVFYCVESGTPGVWRTLADVNSAGTFHSISPARVYDSRKTAELGILAPQSRTISVADKRDPSSYAVTVPNVVPVGATAITFNLTITATAGAGFLSVNEGGNTVIAASTINWSAPGLTIANGSTGRLNANRQIEVICGAGGTQFIVDVLGYYR